MGYPKIFNFTSFFSQETVGQLRKATESFFHRVKDYVKFPASEDTKKNSSSTSDRKKEKEKDKEKSSSTTEEVILESNSVVSSES